VPRPATAAARRRAQRKGEAAQMVVPPPIFQSVRFRLSLTYALAVFVGGTILIGGLYMWQVRQLDEPELFRGRIEMLDPATGRPVDTLLLFDGRRDALQIFEYNAYLRALDELKKASLTGLAILFVVAFAAGWFLAGSALRPVHRMTMVARDITATDLSRRIGLPGPDDEMKGLADTFDAMLDRLQGAFEDQRRFVQDASHELRNPLAVARANLELALSDPNATVADVRASAEVAMRSTERMAALVDDLLDQARSGMPAVARTEVDLVAMAGDVVEEFSAAARQRHLVLALVAPMAPLVAKGDGPALRRALINLVANAVRLAPANTTVTVSVARGDHCAVVSVADAGPGISVADHDNVFKRFWRGDPSGGGTGLGLSIVKQIAERHGGTASVESTLGSGSTFRIKLPIVEERPSTLSAAATPSV
ncbi:MAG: HAMP domain-containing sensor histidine kinase, partial [Acidimicrobiales bacterium]